MSKEQLYDLFQQILNIKKFEHQLLYNAMQVNIRSHLFLLGFAEAEFMNVQCRSGFRTISWVEVSVLNVYIAKQFQTTFTHGEGGEKSVCRRDSE